MLERTGLPFRNSKLGSKSCLVDANICSASTMASTASTKYIYDRLVLCIYGWEYHEKLRPFREYSGPRGNDKSYILVSCGRLELWTRDAEVAAQILGRPRDFVQLDLSSLFVSISFTRHDDSPTDRQCRWQNRSQRTD